MKYLFPFIILVMPFQIIGQKHDAIWQFGYYGSAPHPQHGITYLDFNKFPVEVYKDDGLLSYNLTSTSVCDEDGHLLFYTNGIKIANAMHELMENGDSLNPGTVADAFYEDGYILEQGALILPRPSSNKLYLLFHSKREPPSAGLQYGYVSTFYCTEIDMSFNGGLGKVIKKNHILLSDTLEGAKIIATRHANGRDWWILIPEYDRYSYHRFLIAPDSIYYEGIQNANPSDGYGQPTTGTAHFSPDGSKYARHDIRGFPAGHFVRLYDFDRCTGLLSNQVHIPLTDTAGIGSVAFSPDSRFMYVPSEELIYQFDVTAPDVEATKTIVAVADGYQDTLENGGLWFPTSFRNSQLGPDGRIYVGVAGSHKHLHVIRRPNEPGLACDVRQHDILLPTWNFRSMPNFPNYRLGPLDGSPCDTLGLDNHPLAGFTWEADTLDPLLVQFTDNSFYEPTGWLWDFGGTGSSTEVDPQHSFPADGTYAVCLTVSNPYDSDTFCREVTVEEPTAAGEVRRELAVRVWPNPATTSVTLELPAPLPAGAVWSLHAATGQPVQQEELATGQTQHTIPLAGLPPGLYCWEVRSEGRRMGSGKVVVMQR